MAEEALTNLEFAKLTSALTTEQKRELLNFANGVIAWANYLKEQEEQSTA